MQSLHVQPAEQPRPALTSTPHNPSREVNITDVDDRTKVKLIRWLIDDV